MRTLLLLRHAKSGWGDPTLADSDRPLAPRGRRTAPKIGRWLAAAGLHPSYAVCSTARRARETWALFVEGLGRPVEVRFDERLYQARPATILALVAALPDSAATVVLVGHNPGFEDVAETFAGGGSPSAVRQSLARGFPTAGIAIIESRATNWAVIAAGDGSLRALVRPRELASTTTDNTTGRVTL